MAGSLVQTIRKTGTDGLDYYPTQPWVTRALLGHVYIGPATIWEPACGGGHMSEVLKGIDGADVFSSDVFDHGYPDAQVLDFLTCPDRHPDWIITNPPFKKNLSVLFAKRALSLATEGVALLNRLTWLEGGRRYNELFRDHPPSKIIILTERVGFDVGTCDVGRGGMMPYAWYVWETKDTLRTDSRTEIEWAPPGTKDRLTYPEDAYRFNGSVVR